MVHHSKADPSRGGRFIRSMPRPSKAAARIRPFTLMLISLASVLAFQARGWAQNQRPQQQSGQNDTALSDSATKEHIWFREDFLETPAEIPVAQKHLANEDLRLHRLGPGGDQLKRSFHENIPDDPYYVWSGLCEQRWAIAFEHQSTSADLTSGFIRWRTRQSGDHVLYPIVRCGDRWLVANEGTAANKDWTVQQFELATCKWFELDIKSIEQGSRVAQPDLSNIRAVGCTDLKTGDGSQACSRLDWIEVSTASPNPADQPQP